MKTLQATVNVMAYFMSKMRENYVDGKDIRSSLWHLTRIKDIFCYVIPRILENEVCRKNVLKIANEGNTHFVELSVIYFTIAKKYL